MSEKIDRRIGNTGMILTLLVISLVAGLALFALWRSQFAGKDRVVPGQGVPIRNARPDEPLQVQRYVPAGQVLAGGTVAVRRMTDTQSQAREVLAAVLATEYAVPVLSELKLRGFFLDAAGTAYVDLSVAGPEGIRASAWDELLALYAVVNSLCHNFEDIRQVRFLVEGREAQTVAGHVDINGSFTKRMDLVRQ